MARVIRYILILILLVALILVRYFESSMFYDPLLEFFKTDHTTRPLPELRQGKLLIHTTFRYLINSALSLGILWLVFRKVGIIKVASLIYLILLVIFTLIFWILLQKDGSGDHLLLFYVRRFLIQPLFLLLLLPAFYFQKRSS